MEYQIAYFWTGMGPGTFSADEQALQLRGYTRARHKIWIWYLFMTILGLIFSSTVPQSLDRHFETFLGLPPMWRLTGLIVSVAVGAMVAVSIFIIMIWPVSTSPEEFEKRVVTRIERTGKKISFYVPNPMKPGKLLHIKFRAKSTAEAEQIEQALRTAQERGMAVSISFDVEKEILSGQLSKKEIFAKYGMPVGKLRDILSGELSKREIMIKYAMQPEELEEICKTLRAHCDSSPNITAVGFQEGNGRQPSKEEQKKGGIQ